MRQIRNLLAEHGSWSALQGIAPHTCASHTTHQIRPRTALFLPGCWQALAQALAALS